MDVIYPKNTPKILFIYTSYKVRKKEERKDAKLRAALGRGNQVAIQGTLF